MSSRSLLRWKPSPSIWFRDPYTISRTPYCEGDEAFLALGSWGSAHKSFQADQKPYTTVTPRRTKNATQVIANSTSTGRRSHANDNPEIARERRNGQHASRPARLNRSMVASSVVSLGKAAA